MVGVEEVWICDGWVDCFGLDLLWYDIGYGYCFEDVVKVWVFVDLLLGYYYVVYKLILDYIVGMIVDELFCVVDISWNLLVIVSVWLVSIVDDCV